jgi:hypothetical protein
MSNPNFKFNAFRLARYLAVDTPQTPKYHSIAKLIYPHLA